MDSRRGEPGEAIPSTARRTLARPPGERYASPHESGGPATPPATGSLRRAALVGSIGAIVGAAIIVIVASPLAIAEPLVLVALVTGVAIGRLIRRAAGAGTLIGRRRALALGLSFGAVLIANIVVWQVALAEGGVLGFTDYLLMVFGPIAPLEVVAAGVAAWATA